MALGSGAKVFYANTRSKFIGYQLISFRRKFTLTSSHVTKPSMSLEQFSKMSLLTKESMQLQQKRHLLSKFFNPFGNKDQDKEKKLRFSESHLLGYSKDQMFDVVSKVELYPEFVPWCKESVVKKQGENTFLCRLTVGFPPVVERYTSLVTVARPNIVTSQCSDGLLFSHLLTVWKFSEGLENRPDTCKLDFFVEFEFRSLLHSRLAKVFFDEVVCTMAGAFLKRADKLYGPQSKLKRRKYSIEHKPSDS